MDKETLFSEIYEAFLNGITDDMYITTTEEETNEDLSSFLINSIVRFRGPKVPLRNYDLELQKFNTKLDIDEISILALLMKIDWISRQMHTVNLTEMQYTGSDAKVLNTKAQMATLTALKTLTEKDYEKQLHYYHYHKINDEGYTVMEDFSFSGKGVSNNDLLQQIYKARRE